MTKKHTTSGPVLYADYVVPVYNLNTDMRYLTTYENDELSVDVWAVKATLAQEYESMKTSLLRAEKNYTSALENAPDNENVRRKKIEAKSVRELFINPKFHQVIDNDLKLAVAHHLRARYMKTDLEHAKYLLGFSMFACFKEMMR